MCEQMDAFDKVATILDSKLLGIFFKRIEKFTDRLAQLEQVIKHNKKTNLGEKSYKKVILNRWIEAVSEK